MFPFGGHVVNTTTDFLEVRMDPDKLDKNRNFKQPGKRDTKFFLGFIKTLKN